MNTKIHSKQVETILNYLHLNFTEKSSSCA